MPPYGPGDGGGYGAPPGGGGGGGGGAPPGGGGGGPPRGPDPQLEQNVEPSALSCPQRGHRGMAPSSRLSGEHGTQGVPSDNRRRSRRDAPNSFAGTKRT